MAKRNEKASKHRWCTEETYKEEEEEEQKVKGWKESKKSERM